MTLGEDQIDLFERPLCRLRVVDVDERQEARIDDGEEEVRPPACITSANTPRLLTITYR